MGLFDEDAEEGLGGDEDETGVLLPSLDIDFTLPTADESGLLAAEAAAAAAAAAPLGGFEEYEDGGLPGREFGL